MSELVILVTLSFEDYVLEDKLRRDLDVCCTFHEHSEPTMKPLSTDEADAT